MLRTAWQWLRLLPRVMRLGHQMPMNGILSVIDTLEEGRKGKYAKDPLTWRKYSAKHHFFSAYLHWGQFLDGNEDEPHLAHMATRAVMACETGKENQHGGLS